MAIDRAVLESVENKMSPPTLRIYQWEKPCISLGYFQNPDNELNWQQVRADGVDVVKRMTGGRAVYHIGELAYSVCCRNDEAEWCGTKETSYQVISRALIKVLESLEGNMEFSLSRSTLKSNATGEAMLPCFSSPARFEVEWNQKKIVGSAQRRKKEAFLQHGSILFNRDHLQIIDYLKLNELEKKSYLKELNANAISLSECSGRRVYPTEIVEDFKSQFSKEWGVTIENGELLDQEVHRIDELGKAYSLL